ncbi:MAG: gliding motility-associated C-terminal domain-containing protein, partial [Crocinitomicaceae bacterium]|nr:gliding motility-associated C-terminal domain-containing protein [Crocinitomicaceae bacterium]
VVQLITVNDTIPPTASNPPTINVSCASDIPLIDVNVVSDEADNCTTNPVVAHVSDVSDGNVCNGETITRTYSVTDDCGNETLVTQTIIIDVVTPTVDAGVDQSVCEGTAVSLTASNYPATANISWDNGVIDGVAFNPPVGTNTYTVVASECNGECFNSDQVDVTVNPTPSVSFVADTLVGCEPLVVEFTNTSTEQFDCTWDFGDGNTSNNCGPVTNSYVIPGLFDVTLTVTSAAGCTASETYADYIEIVALPEASFSASSTLIDVEDTEVDFINNSIGADNYIWDFGDNTIGSNQFEPTHIFPEVGDQSYTVTLWAYNAIGCVDSTELDIYVEDVLVFYVPNAVTPDGDSFNDEFKPIFSGGLDIYDYHLTIFNRWGEIIFESYNVDYGWNGHYGDGGLVQDGVYVWQLEFGETMSDKKHTHRGHVTVLK